MRAALQGAAGVYGEGAADVLPKGDALLRSFFERDVLIVAQELLGMLLVHRQPGATRVARIVETEAYQGFDDRASHAYRGRTPRNAIMFGPAGFVYVYLVYGLHHCLNLVTGPEGYPAAVLIRAAEPWPLAGVDRKLQRTMSGPGKLCKMMGIDRSHSGLDVCVGELTLCAPPRSVTARRTQLGSEPPTALLAPRIVATPRIGIDYAGESKLLPWRFYDADSPSVSK